MTKYYLLNILLQGLAPVLTHLILLSNVQFVSIDINPSKASGMVSLTFTGLYNCIVIYFWSESNTCEYFQVQGITHNWLGTATIPRDILYDKNYVEILRNNYELVYHKFPELRYKASWPVQDAHALPSILVDKSCLNNPYNRGAK